MLDVETLTLGSLNTNCYVLTDNDSQQAFIIDPADNGDFISETLLRNHATPIGILLTHGHFDHVLATLELKLNFNLPIYLHPADLFLHHHANQSAQHWLGEASDPVPPPDRGLKDGQIITLGESELMVVATPGHTPGSVCFYSPADQIIFTGDTLFHSDVGRTDFSYSNSKQLKKSLSALFSLPADTIVYPGHGEISTIGTEKMLNLNRQ